MNAYHVVATVESENTSPNVQKHFFVKSECASSAVGLVEARIGSNGKVKITVKEAENHSSPGMKEEVYFL